MRFPTWIYPEPPHPEMPRKAHSDWSMSQERAFFEDLVNKRLTSFLTIFGAVIAGAIATTKMPVAQAALLLIGASLAGALTSAIGRAQMKLDVLLWALNRDYDHPIAWTNRQVPSKPRLRIIGYLVPKFCCFVLIALATASLASIFISHMRAS